MEKEQIGTDASMPTHVNNIVVRGYVEVVSEERRMRPTILGVWLIHGLRAIDAELTQAAVRARIEKDVTEVANGQKSCEDVVTQALIVFRDKFEAVRRGIPTLKEVLEATKEKKDTWQERAAAQQQQKVEEPPEDEAGVIVGPKPLMASEVSRAAPKRPREEQPSPAAARNVRARTTGSASASGVSGAASSSSGGGQPRGAAEKAVAAAANGTPAQKLRAENKVLSTKLAIAELRAENAELKFKDMERKFADLEARVATLKSQKKKGGGRGKGKG